jgi:hypothetical protein
MHRSRQHREHLQVRLIGPDPLQQRRILDLPGADAGQLLILRARLVGVHQVTRVPAVTGADAQAGDRGAVGQLDAQ